MILLRHAVAFSINEEDGKERLNKACDRMNQWIEENFHRIDKPIKKIEIISGQFDIKGELAIGISIESED